MSHAARLDITEGPLFGSMVRFILPLILTNLLQVLYNVADSVIMGLSSEPDAVGAIGTTTVMINLIVNVFIGCSVGAKVTVARCIGEKDPDAVGAAVHTAVAVGALFGTLCAVVGFSVSRAVLVAMGNSGRLLTLATTYARLCFLGAPFIALTNFAIAVLQAEGDTRTPLWALGCAGLFNVLSSFFFVIVCGMSVEGAAAGTVLSNALSAVWLLAHLARDRGSVCHLVLRRIRLDKRAFLSILHIGVPAAVQGALFSLSHLVIQSSIVAVEHTTVPPGSAYQPVIKGNTAATAIESFGSTMVGAVGQAALTFVGQNAGAGKEERVRAVRRLSYLLAICLCVLFTAIALLFRASLLRLWGIGRDGDALDGIAYDTAVTRMLCMFVPYFLLGCMEVGSGVMQGLGRSVTSTVVSLTGSVVFRLLWIAVVFRACPTLVVVYLSYPITWLLTAAAHWLCGQYALRRTFPVME